MIYNQVLDELQKYIKKEVDKMIEILDAYNLWQQKLT